MRHPLKYFLCPSCNCSNSKPGANHCPDCGAELIKECSRCKKIISNAHQSHCRYCGYEYRGRHS